MTSISDHEAFGAFIIEMTENIYKHLTYNRKKEDRAIDIYNRINFLTWICKYGHSECLTFTKRDFEKLMNEKVEIDPDYRVLAYCNGIRQGGKEEFEFLKQRYLNTHFQEEQLNILQGMACVESNLYQVFFFIFFLSYFY